MQAIQTKFFGWNSARQAYRIKATAPAGSVWHQFGQLHVDIEPEHEKAARALVDRFGWNMDIVGGTLADTSMVWVLAPKPAKALSAYVSSDDFELPKAEFLRRVRDRISEDIPLESERIEWTRIKNDVNGNGRIVCHFLNLNTRAELDRTGVDWIPTDEKYRLALARAHTIGGRKFNNKQYGGGIVFTGDISEIEAHIARVTQ